MKYIVFVLLTAGCTNLPPPEQERTDSVIAGCQASCDTLRRLGCPEGTPEGETCEAVCSDAERSGIVDIDTSCLSNISSCDQIDTC